MNKTLFYLLLPFMPKYWIMNESFSKEWDNTLNKLLSKYNFTERTEHTAYLGQNKIWIANHPHASMTPYQLLSCEFRPSRYTVYKAYEKLNKDAPKIKKKHLETIDSINKQEGF